MSRIGGSAPGSPRRALAPQRRGREPQPQYRPAIDPWSLERRPGRGRVAAEVRGL